VAAARTLARRLVERFGTPIATPWPDVDRLFPDAATLAAAHVEQVAELGIIRTRAAAINGIAQGWPAIAAQIAARTSPDALIDHLRALPGIGAWTAHYIAMRALGWPDAFPPGDVAILNAMKQGLGPATHRAIETHAQAWRPWRAYAVLRLWNSLENRS
jgi:AraC family transcriptional regulator of adaptative response / DNA-3-methyladenine glycosylase II